MMETSTTVIQIEDIIQTIFQPHNYDKHADAYYLVLPTPYVEMWDTDTPENRYRLFSFSEKSHRERITFDVRTVPRFFGYETQIDPSRGMQLIPRSDYRPKNPLPFDKVSG
jgi:hypothetical protein